MIFLISIIIVSLAVSCHAVTDAEFCSLLDDYNEFKDAFDNYLSHQEGSCNSVNIHTDCMSIKKMFPASLNDEYTIEPSDGQGPFQAYCDMTTDGGGWMVIQRRSDGTEDFYRNWFEYRNGFGNISSEFWLGNENIHRVTKQKAYEVRFDLTDFDGNNAYATFDVFSVSDMSEFYKVTVSSSYVGTAGDSFSSLNGAHFASHDLDPTGCATKTHGAWWFLDSKCSPSDLNGKYNDTATDTGILWTGWKGNDYSLRSSEMKIRPKI